MFSTPYAAYDLLRTHHKVNVVVQILDNANGFLFDASKRLISGGLDIDADAEVTRSGEAVLLDPLNELDLNSNAAGLKFYNRQVYITYQIESLFGAGTYEWPLFLGPITKASRSGVSVEIEFGGKEEFSREGLRNDYTYPAGWCISDIIYNALVVLTGEVLFDWQVPFNTGPTISENWTIARGDNVINRLRELAASANWVLFYNGYGRACLRPKNLGVMFTLDTSWLTGEPSAEFSIDGIYNDVIVTGANLPDADVEYLWQETAPPDHPYSPQNIARNGFPRYLTLFIEDDKINSYSAAQRRAVTELQQALLRNLDIGVTCSVLPCVEEWDVFGVNHPKFVGYSMLTKASIPLVGDGEMSVGFLSSTSDGGLRPNFVAGNNADTDVFNRVTAAANAAARAKRAKEAAARRKKRRAKKKAEHKKSGADKTKKTGTKKKKGKK